MFLPLTKNQIADVVEIADERREEDVGTTGLHTRND